jgi:hypothetical protein
LLFLRESDLINGLILGRTRMGPGALMKLFQSSFLISNLFGSALTGPGSLVVDAGACH